MALNLLNLLMGQQGTVPEELANEILVQAPQDRPEAEIPDYNDAPSRGRVDPRYVLNDDRIAPRPEELKEILPRRGKFGVKGTLREILGTLGDAFLVQGGRDAVYEPRRQRERAGDAMFGAADDPLQAAERLAAQGFVKEAQDLIAETQNNDYRQGMLASTEGNRQDMARDRAYTNVMQAQTQLQRILANANSPEQRKRLIDYYGPLLAGRAGVTPQDIGIFENMSDEDIDAFARGDMTVNQTEALPLRKEQLRISQQNADSARIAATRPRNPPPRPRADTDQEYYRDLSQVPPNQRTVEENEWMQMYINGRSRGGRRDGRRDVQPAPRAGWGTVTRGD